MTLSALALVLVYAAHADDKVDVLEEWIEPTCDQIALGAAVAARSVSMCGAQHATDVTWQYQPEQSPLGCHLWVHAWCPDPKAPPYQAPGAVSTPTVYADNDFKGTALVLDGGPHELVTIPVRDGGNWRQKIGSVRVPAGWTLRLCSESGGAGRCSDFTGDNPRLQDTYVNNDAAAYGLVGRGQLPPAYACPRVFENDGFGGKYLDVCADVADLTGGQWNDTISSVLVPAGWTIDLCANAQGSAPCATLTADTRALGSTIVGADKATSIMIKGRPK